MNFDKTKRIFAEIEESPGILPAQIIFNQLIENLITALQELAAMQGTLNSFIQAVTDLGNSTDDINRLADATDKLDRLE